MRELTALAEGTKLKGGAVRRIVVTMSEETFLRVRDKATAEDRSLSNQIVRYVERGLFAHGVSQLSGSKG
jgi:hypothetical protein